MAPANIHPTLSQLTVPIAGLQHYGKNPRKGDVAAIAHSLEVNGQYKPIVVRTGTMEVLAGNHTLKAARELGWEQIAATFVDVDDDRAARIVLVDNRTNEVLPLTGIVLDAAWAGGCGHSTTPPVKQRVTLRWPRKVSAASTVIRRTPVEAT